ncbi:amino acid ABC transporter permease/ATP-binding protein [Hylemonella sp. W303a]|uniref:amino acid ABC transporter permease/ATP-binding protein n=1 Tax=Hylemonella sp. W303a TaxID=3389873 RepID=UPI00396B0E50
MELDWTYFFSLFSMGAFYRASVTVITLGSLAWSLGLVLGFGLAQAEGSRLPWLRWPAKAYIWFFRSVPLLVLLVFVYNLPQIFPATGAVLGVPFGAGLVGLVMTEAAYMAEIHRGGLLSVVKGQREAAQALGLGWWSTQLRIVLPQAFRIALPTLTNEFVTIIKLTSLVSVISLPELLLTGQRLYTQNFLILETLLAVAVYYVAIVTVFGALLGALERRLDVVRRQPDALAGPALERLRHGLGDGPLMPRPDRGPGAPPALELMGIHKAYGAHAVLKGVNLVVEAGEVISIIGPSGSGKTSLIRTVNALESLDRGEIVLFGESHLQGGAPMDAARVRRGIRRIGMVFQGFNLFPHLTVLQNILLAPGLHGQGSATEQRERALRLLDKVGLLAHLHKYPHQLSGGQQQRVAIARALALRPEVMLFDEPTSALDPELVGDVLKVIQDLASEGMTMLIVTHEMEFALQISDRIVFMENGLLQVDVRPEQLRQARSGAGADDPIERVRRFMQLSH